MRKRFSAAIALALSCAMMLTACSGSKPAETTAAAADTTAAAAETTAAAAPSGDVQKLTMGTGADGDHDACDPRDKRGAERRIEKKNKKSRGFFSLCSYKNRGNRI